MHRQKIAGAKAINNFHPAMTALYNAADRVCSGFHMTTNALYNAKAVWSGCQRVQTAMQKNVLMARHYPLAAT